MARNATHSVTLDGRTYTRKSARTYTHAIVGRPSRDLAHQQVVDACSGSFDRNNWEFMASTATDAYWAAQAVKWPTLYGPAAGERGQQRRREDQAKGVAFVQQYPTAHHYLDAMTRTRWDAFNAQDAAGVFTTDVVLAWSQGAHNAAKAVGTWQKRYTHVRAVECTRTA